MNEELLYTQEDIDEWMKTCEELQEKVKEQEETIEQLSEYKRLEEQGLLVRLPCKVGDTFYRVTYFYGGYKIITDTVFGFTIRPSMNIENRKVLICNSMGASFWLGEHYEKECIFYEFITLDKVEAEKKLAELKGENNGSN